jgi:hypothetical protein
MGGGMGGWVGLQKLTTVLDMKNGYKGGALVYKAYEVTKKGGKIRCLLLRRQKIFFYIYEVFTWDFF